MRYTSLLDISLEQIQFFLAVAKMKSFTKAAEVLYVSQPLLSRRISLLEQEIGLQLFYRDKRKIRLTEEGEWLYREWDHLIGRVEASLEEARKIKNSVRRRITVGCDEMLQPMDNLLLPLMEPCMTEEQGYDVNLECYEYSALRKQFMDHTMDVIITGSCEPPNGDDNLRWEKLISVPHCVGISRKNPLAQKDEVLWEDLKDETFLMLSAAISEDYHKSILSLCRQHGFDPTIKTYLNKASILINLELNNGIHLGSSFNFVGNDRSIRQYELPGAMTHIFIGWCDEKDTVREFVDAVRTIASQLYPPAQ